MYWHILSYNRKPWNFMLKKREIAKKKKNGDEGWYDVFPPSLYSARAGEVLLSFTTLVNKVWQPNKYRDLKEEKKKWKFCIDAHAIAQCNSSVFFMKKHVLISDPSESTKPPAGIELWSRHACQLCWTETIQRFNSPHTPNRGRKQVKQMPGEGGVCKETCLHTHSRWIVGRARRMLTLQLLEQVSHNQFRWIAYVAFAHF